MTNSFKLTPLDSNILLQAAMVQSTDTTSTPTSYDWQVDWYSTGFKAIDLGVGSNGDVYAVSQDGLLYQYDYAKNAFNKVTADRELTGLRKVDVDDEGTPYVITSDGSTFYLNCFNNWIQLPGLAKDIGAGRGGEVWKIGVDQRTNGFGIWKLFCECKPTTCGRKCNRWRNKDTTEVGDIRKCTWNRIEGGAVRISVKPDGNPIVTESNGSIFSYDGVDWNPIGDLTASDISVSNEGLVFTISQTDQSIKRLVCTDQGNCLWGNLSGDGKSIGVGPYSEPWMIGLDDVVYTTAKMPMILS